MLGRSLQLLNPVARLRAEVVHGFGRGSKELGFPTANLKICWDAHDPSTLTREERTMLDFARGHAAGIYCAFGCLEDGPDEVHKVALSMGWNPTFNDVKTKVMEAWILHDFPEQFYGRHLRLLVVGYFRQELKFESLEELKREIHADGEFCRTTLASDALAHHRSDRFLLSRPSALMEQGRQVHGTVHEVFPPGVPVHVDLSTVLLGLLPVPSDTARLLLVRHGESSANEQGLLCGGGLDPDLNAAGRNQAQRVSEELCGIIHVDVVGSSGLSRAQETADIIAEAFPTCTRAVIADFREMMYGVLEGASITDARSEMSVVMGRWRSGDMQYRVARDGECPDEVADRALRALCSLLRAHVGRTVLVVGHSWVNKLVVAAMSPGGSLTRMVDVTQRNCAVNVVDARFCESREEFRVLGVDLRAGEMRNARL